MPNVLDSISPGFKALSAQLAAAGFNVAELLAATDANFLKSKIASLPGNSADVEAAITEATAHLTKERDEAKSAAQVAVALNTTYAAGFAKAGVQVKAADEKAGITAEEVSKAIADRASIKASEQLAQHRLDAPLPVSPAADSTKPAQKPASNLTGLARVTEALRSEAAARAAAL